MWKTINWTTTFNKWICNLTPEVRDILKTLLKRGEFLLFSTIFCYLFLDFYVKTGTRISLWDKWLFEISEVKNTRVDCIYMRHKVRKRNSRHVHLCSLISLLCHTIFAPLPIQNAPRKDFYVSAWKYGLIWTFPWMCVSWRYTHIIYPYSHSLYTDTRYNDRLHYNDHLTDTKPSLKRRQLVRLYVKILYLIIQETYDLDIC